MKPMIAALALTVAMIGTPAWGQATLPIAGYQPIDDVPGAKHLPNPALNYKVLFEVTKGAEKPGDVNPSLIRVARYLNTLAKYGVPADRRHLAIVIYGAATDALLQDKAYAARYADTSNPNLKLLKQLHDTGVDVMVCGQAIRMRKIDPSELAPEVQLTLSATVTMINLQTEGYVRVE